MQGLKWEPINTVIVEQPRWPAYNLIMTTYGRNPARGVYKPRIFYELHRILINSIHNILFQERLCQTRENG